MPTAAQYDAKVRVKRAKVAALMAEINELLVNKAAAVADPPKKREKAKKPSKKTTTKKPTK